MKKENGILISSYLGIEKNDCALLYLKKILFNIAKEIYKKDSNRDVRELLKLNKNEIQRKVTLV